MAVDIPFVEERVDDVDVEQALDFGIADREPVAAVLPAATAMSAICEHRIRKTRKNASEENERRT
jgi:hypothetical protein